MECLIVDCVTTRLKHSHTQTRTEHAADEILFSTLLSTAGSQNLCTAESAMFACVCACARKPLALSDILSVSDLFSFHTMLCIAQNTRHKGTHTNIIKLFRIRRWYSSLFHSIIFVFVLSLCVSPHLTSYYYYFCTYLLFYTGESVVCLCECVCCVHVDSQNSQQ